MTLLHSLTDQVSFALSNMKKVTELDLITNNGKLTEIMVFYPPANPKPYKLTLKPHLPDTADLPSKSVGNARSFPVYDSRGSLSLCGHTTVMRTPRGWLVTSTYHDNLSTAYVPDHEGEMDFDDFDNVNGGTLT